MRANQAEPKPPAAPAPDTELLRVGIVAPTFNNARTLEAVLKPLLAMDLDVIVVNDGSTDETTAVLATLSANPQLHVVTHAHNRGKACALRSGFDHASTLGLTHVLTIDTDGQHDTADVPPILHAAREHPAAIVVGTRTVTPDYPWKSWIGRECSNALVWIIGGVCVKDSQCGLRVYPLDVVRELGAETSRYAFETEVLARAGWAGVKVTDVPVRCIYDVAGGRVTHFRPCADTWSAILMHARLVTRSCSPWPVKKLSAAGGREASGETGRETNRNDGLGTGTIAERLLRWMNPLHMWRRIKVDPGERERLAASMAWGVVVGYTPPLGWKTVLCLLLAKRFRLQPLVTLATSSLATPPLGVVFWAMSIATGHLLLHGQLPIPGQYNFDHGAFAAFRQLAFEWALGSLVCGATVGTLTYLLVRAAGRLVPLSSRVGKSMAVEID